VTGPTLYVALVAVQLVPLSPGLRFALSPAARGVDQVDRHRHRDVEPAPAGKAEVWLRALADLIQPSHLLRAVHRISV